MSNPPCSGVYLVAAHAGQHSKPPCAARHFIVALSLQISVAVLLFEGLQWLRVIIPRHYDSRSRSMTYVVTIAAG